VRQLQEAQMVLALLFKFWLYAWSIKLTFGGHLFKRRECYLNPLSL